MLKVNDIVCIGKQKELLIVLEINTNKDGREIALLQTSKSKKWFRTSQLLFQERPDSVYDMYEMFGMDKPDD